ncbi:TauD/TfdA family dioxygenase [Streptoalloteichus hindustanus]|uniref:N-Dimethylarginine dimethylaminohydrolase n=1 Tax=Streptoalloteichus hindustanus TaxID=2017 RepID=A0A1M4ZDX2_STRHI|nr:TauD/TfdA family dioxygenase [Streptoalloteichus hindustanus]SHF15982.1 N-Dimethylarginine dimethylaminohydrolase [Streptoalloteichus hindustanus]
MNRQTDLDGIVRLSPEDTRRIAAVANELDVDPQPRARSAAEWAEFAASVATAMPAALTQAAQRFATDGAPNHVLVVRGLPVDEHLQPTPTADDHRELGGTARRGVLAALGVLALLGRPPASTTPTASTGPREIPVARHITPALGQKRAGGPGEAVLLWRGADIPGDASRAHFGLLCLRGRPTTLFATARSLALEARWEQVLRDTRFVLHPNGAEPHPRTVLSGPRSDPRIGYDSLLLRPHRPDDAEAVEALRRLAVELRRVARRHVLEPGDFLLVDNHRTVHAHLFPRADRDNADWWLSRVLAPAVPPAPTAPAAPAAPTARHRRSTAPAPTPPAAPAGSAPPTNAPRTSAPPTTKVPPTSTPSTGVPPASASPTSAPPTSAGPPAPPTAARHPAPRPAPVRTAERGAPASGPPPVSRQQPEKPRPAHSHDEFSPLREVIVGDAANARIPDLQRDPSAWLAFYPDLTAAELTRVRTGRFPDRVLAETEEDLDRLVGSLRELGVVVHRPAPVDHDLMFVTPDWSSSGVTSYCPRDLTLVLGSTIIEAPSPTRSRQHELSAFRALFRRYLAAGSTWISAPRPELRDELYGVDDQGHPTLGEAEPAFDAANVLRCGRDLFYQVSVSGNEAGLRWLRSVVSLLGDYRVHPMHATCPGSHVDTALALIRPGLLLANPTSFTDDTLPKPLRRWEVLWCPPMREAAPLATPWPLASSWVGMNLLMVAPDLAIVDAAQGELIATLERHGVRVLPHSLRHARVLGGGFHCVTLDTVRDGELRDYCG